MRRRFGRLRQLFSTPNGNSLLAKRRSLRVEPLEGRWLLSIGTLHVDVDSEAPAPDGLTWETAYPALQDALDRAVVLNTDAPPENDISQIWIADGTYKPTALLDVGDPRTATFSMLDGVSIYGGFYGDPDEDPKEDLDSRHGGETILSGDIDDPVGLSDGDAYHVVYASNITDVTLDVLTITGGNADGTSSPHDRGAGMYNYSGTPTINNVMFSGNLARYGAGLFNGAPEDYENVLQAPYAVLEEGPEAIRDDNYTDPAQQIGSAPETPNSMQATITFPECSIAYVSYRLTGQVYQYDYEGAEAHGFVSLQVDDSYDEIASGGASTPSTQDGHGYNLDERHNTNDENGGLGWRNVTGMRLHSWVRQWNCCSSANAVHYEMAAWARISFPSAELTSCTFVDNSASNHGGAIYNENASPTLLNSVFRDNLAANGGAISNQSSDPTIINSTFTKNTASNSGGGMYNEDSSPIVANSILWGNTTPEGGQIHTPCGAPEVTYSDVEDGEGGLPWPGEDNIDADPEFLDPENGDLRLRPGLPGMPGSLCIDAGNNSAVPEGVEGDLDGNPRIVDDPFTPPNGTAVVDMGAYESPDTDFGDAPDPRYPTLLVHNGAWHRLVEGGPFMGALVDPETDGLPHGSALGDDIDYVDDEDGVSFTTVLIPGDPTASVEIDMTSSPVNGVLNAWMDFNDDGDWGTWIDEDNWTPDDGEQIFIDRYIMNGSVRTLLFPVPEWVTASTVVARFRVSSTTGLSWLGPADDGEVEDYRPETASIWLSHDRVGDNAAVGTEVGKLSINDLGISDTFSYELVAGEGGDHNELFAIDGRQLKAAAVLDFEGLSSYSILVRATDTEGLWFEDVLTIEEKFPILPVDLDGDGQDEVVIDYGDSYGLCLFDEVPIDEGPTWDQFQELGGDFMVKGDLNANGEEELIVDFGDLWGIYVYDGQVWEDLHHFSSEYMVTANVNDDPNDEVIIDFGNEYGIWIYYPASDTWWQLRTSGSDNLIVAANLDEDEVDEIVFDFGAVDGLWIWDPNTDPAVVGHGSWAQLLTWSPDSIVKGDLDADPRDDLVIDWGGGRDIDIYYNDETWAELHTASSEHMTVGNVNGDATDEVIIDFGSEWGIWIYDFASGTPVSRRLDELSSDFNYSLDYMVSGDINGGGKDDIIIDFFQQWGTWVWKDDSEWEPLGATIQGAKWHDFNEDGVRDEGEPGLKDWTIYIDSNGNGELDPDSELSTLTKDNGDYAFDGLPYAFGGLRPGTYTVREVGQSGWRQTFPQAAEEIVVVPLPGVEGMYGPGTARTAVYDAGVRFTEITGLSLDWSGQITAGLGEYTGIWKQDRELFDWPAQFLALTPPSRPNFLASVNGGTTFGVPDPFDEVTPLSPFIGDPSFDVLLSGQGELLIDFAPLIVLNGDMLSPPSGQVSNAQLRIGGRIAFGGYHQVELLPGQVKGDINFGNYDEHLYWDEEGSGDWDYIDSVTGHSRWVDGAGNPLQFYPSESHRAVIRTDTVTLSSDWRVCSLTVESGKFVVAYDATLSVVGDVAGNLEIAETAGYEPQLGRASSGLIDVEGTASLAGTLSVTGITPMLDAEGKPTWCDKTLTIIEMAEGSEAGIFEEFETIPMSYGSVGGGSEPPVPNMGTYLGNGMWFGNLADGEMQGDVWTAIDDGVYYPGRVETDGPATAVQIGVFQAAPGDVDGDADVDISDIMAILARGKFGDGPSDATWGEGDFDGDGDVDISDIMMVLATGLFGKGRYCPVDVDGGGADDLVTALADLRMRNQLLRTVVDAKHVGWDGVPPSLFDPPSALNPGGTGLLKEGGTASQPTSQVPASQAVWLGALDPWDIQDRPAKKRRGIEKAVDNVLTAYWP